MTNTPFHRVPTMRILTFLTACLVGPAILLTAASAPAQSAQTGLTPAALQGMWKLTSLSMDGREQPTSGYMVFMGERYLFVTTRGDPPTMSEGISRKAPDQLTDAEKTTYVEAFRT